MRVRSARSSDEKRPILQQLLEKSERSAILPAVTTFMLALTIHHKLSIPSRGIATSLMCILQLNYNPYYHSMASLTYKIILETLQRERF